MVSIDPTIRIPMFDETHCLLCHDPAYGAFFLAPGGRIPIPLCSSCQLTHQARTEKTSGLTVPNKPENCRRMAALRGVVALSMASQIMGVKEYAIDNFWEERTMHSRAFHRLHVSPAAKQKKDASWGMFPSSTPGWYWFDPSENESPAPAIAYPLRPDGPSLVLLDSDEKGVLFARESGIRATEMKGLWFSERIVPPKSV